MELKLLTSKSDEWNTVIGFADSCSWKAGKSLADEMRKNNFHDWERVIVATEKGNIIGYRTVKKDDCIPNLFYTPYIGYFCIGRIMIIFAMAYLRELGIDKVYLISDHINLYEK